MACLTRGSGQITICTGSWAVFWGLTGCLSGQSRPGQLAIAHYGDKLWKDLWTRGLKEGALIYHVSGHHPELSPGNDVADALARARTLQELPLMEMGQWLHKKLGCVGPRTMCKVAQRWHILLIFAGAKQVVLACAHCAHFYQHRHRLPMFQRD